MSENKLIFYRWYFH